MAILLWGEVWERERRVAPAYVGYGPTSVTGRSRPTAGSLVLRRGDELRPPSTPNFHPALPDQTRPYLAPPDLTRPNHTPPYPNHVQKGVSCHFAEILFSCPMTPPPRRSPSSAAASKGGSTTTTAASRPSWPDRTAASHCCSGSAGTDKSGSGSTSAKSTDSIPGGSSRA